MSKDNEIIILKLGGSLITDKNKPFSLRKDVIGSAIQQIIKSKKRIILIHGGGSFGHPIAKTYNIIDGLNPLIEDQIIGLAETHDAMNNLNSHIVNVFLEERFSVITFQSSSIFIKTKNKIKSSSIDTIEIALELGMMPILYGDIIFDDNKSFSIISGDEIILKLCNNLRKYKVQKAIFAMEVDGILVKEGEEIKLATEIQCEELDNLNLADMDKKIDVTGGIQGKLNSIKKICKLGIPVQIINGLKENFILNALIGEDLNSTNISSSRNF